MKRNEQSKKNLILTYMSIKINLRQERPSFSQLKFLYPEKIVLFPLVTRMFTNGSHTPTFLLAFWWETKKPLRYQEKYQELQKKGRLDEQPQFGKKIMRNQSFIYPLEKQYFLKLVNY